MAKIAPLGPGSPEMNVLISIIIVGNKNSIKWYVACHGYLKNHQSYIEKKCNKKIEKMSLLAVKIELKKIQQSSISYDESSLNPNIIFLCEKLWPVAWKQEFTSKKRKNENFEKQKHAFFLMSQGSLDPKIRFLVKKVCLVARVQSHRHENE